MGAATTWQRLRSACMYPMHNGPAEEDPEGPCTCPTRSDPAEVDNEGRRYEGEHEGNGDENGGEEGNEEGHEKGRQEFREEEGQVEVLHCLGQMCQDLCLPSGRFDKDKWMKNKAGKVVFMASYTAAKK
ncbi:unnamed protein product [Polarella glacialis]|uniref:Uncharacterized protein n=1 Tax=Polarella glacialis TaxID=89957 RepID=A0A813LZ19_POLGL|nr:unnamed protein product [Polarella glacialis]